MKHIDYIEPEGAVQTGKGVDDVWVSDDTCYLVPVWNYELHKTFMGTIKDAFKRQGGYMRHCVICAEPFPYFPDGYDVPCCLNLDCETQYWETIENEKEVDEPAAITVSISEQRKPRPKKQAVQYRIGDRAGYVYLMQAENGLCKIGRAKNVEARRCGIERDIPMKVLILHYFASKDYISAEKYLHNKYEEYRIRYEWFKLNSTHITQIQAIGDYNLDAQL